MSCYEWERGVIKLPAKEWTKFKNSIIAKHNDIIDSSIDLSNTAFEEVKKEHGTSRKNKEYYSLLQDKLLTKFSRTMTGYESQFMAYLILPLYFKENSYDKMYKAKKTDIKALKLNNKTTSIHYDDIAIGFNSKTKELFWNIEENNHAVENGRNTRLGSYVLGLLNRINWTSKTGGIIVGNDEYNREDSDACGGGNYITSYFGGIGKREHESSMKVSRRRMGVC